MRDELDKKLCSDYPKLFRNRHLPMTQTCMCWGFECGDGWYNIINTLCMEIQGHIDSIRKRRIRQMRFNRALKKALATSDVSFLVEYYIGKSDIVPKWVLDKIEEHLNNPKFFDVIEKPTQVVVDQVKEKFGTLRFYYTGGDDHIRAIVSFAETMTAFTCEQCGSPGKLHTSGWHYVACKTHTKDEDLEYEV